jgi:3-hydroxyisobutyrate dehydrogenase
MGAGFVRRARANGWDVNVWNRSPAKTRALVELGARAFDDAAAALQGVERIHLSLADDASVDAVLEPIAAAIPSATWIVDHTTTAVRPTAERVARWDARGRVFVHAPVFMAPAHCAEGSGLMLVSGQKSRHDALLPALQQMTGTVHYMGAAPERAAAFKLFGNLTLLGILGVLGDVNRLAHAVGISTDEAFGLFKQFNPGQMLPARAARIAAGDYSNPSFEVAMARKDVRLMIEEAQRGGIDLFVMPGVAAMFDAAIARGEGALDAAAAARAPD